MRRVFFIILLLSSFGTTAQVFNFKVDWFDNNSFFEAAFLQSKKVESISISVSEKKDGAYFQGARPILRYDFNANGQLKRSYKLIPLKNKIDTALFHCSYMGNGRNRFFSWAGLFCSRNDSVGTSSNENRELAI